jgi:hypothetical protein
MWIGATYFAALHNGEMPPLLLTGNPFIWDAAMRCPDTAQKGATSDFHPLGGFDIGQRRKGSPKRLYGP